QSNLKKIDETFENGLFIENGNFYIQELDNYFGRYHFSIDLTKLNKTKNNYYLLHDNDIVYKCFKELKGKFVLYNIKEEEVLFINFEDLLVFIKNTFYKDFINNKISLIKSLIYYFIYR